MLDARAGSAGTGSGDSGADGAGPPGTPLSEAVTARKLLPKWIAVFFVGCAVVLVPWTVIIFGSLRNRALAEHWRLVWGGFDCFLVLAFALTAYRIITKSPRGAIAATATGTMLLIDAWFDVLTARGTKNLMTSLAMALFAEIPCAIISFYVARKIVGLFEQAMPHLQAAGFRMVAGRLIPPTPPAATPQAATPQASTPGGPPPLGQPPSGAPANDTTAGPPPHDPANGYAEGARNSRSG